MLRLRTTAFAALVVPTVLATVACSSDEVTRPSDDISPSLARAGGTSVTITPDSGTIAVGAVLALTANVSVDRGTAGEVGWRSADSGIATVSATGEVRGIAPGTARIVAKYKRVADTATVTVTAGGTPTDPTPPQQDTVPAQPVVTKVVVALGAGTINVGQTTTATAAAFDAAGKPITGRAVAWSTSSASVATVTPEGTVSGVGAGTAKISATIDGQSGEAVLTVNAPTTVPPVSGVGCSAYSATRVVNVATAAQLTTALANAQPGDRIQMADGTYLGHFSASNSGTSDRPIVLCGSRAAVINSGTTSTWGFVMQLYGSHWILDGFSVTNAQQGIRVSGARNVTLRRLEVHHIGNEAIRFAKNASHNVAEENFIHDTGLLNTQFGEGVYVGSWSGHWTNSQPDRSDSNVVRNNTIGPNVSAEMVDIKEGTTGTIVSGNTFDGRGQTIATTNLQSWVIALGNNALVTGNRGTIAVKHGFMAWSIYSGWGKNNVFRNNVADLSGAPGYAYYVASGATGTVVGCSNTATNAGSGFSNVACTQ